MLAMIPVLRSGVISSSLLLLSTTKIEGLKPCHADSLFEEGEAFLVDGCSSRFKAAMACNVDRLALLLSRELATLEWFEDEETPAECSILAVSGVVCDPGAAGLEKEKELSAGDDGDMPPLLLLLLAEEYVGAGLRVGTTAGGVSNGDDSCSCSNRDGNNDIFDAFLVVAAAAGGGFFWGVSWVRSTHNE